MPMMASPGTHHMHPAHYVAHHLRDGIHRARFVATDTLREWIVRFSNRGAHAHGYCRYHVWLGSLAGRTLVLPRLEQPAMVLGTYERHVVAALRRYVHPGAVTFDVGTHAGYMTLVLAKLVGPGGHVYACEPDPVNRGALECTVAANHLRNVTPLALAIADRAGTAPFAHFDTYSLVGRLAGPDTPDDASIIQVETASLDGLIYGRGMAAPTLVKIDVEGAEMEVLTGARRLLSERRPVVVVEMRPKYRDALTAFLAEVGYRSVLLEGTEGEWQRKGVADLLLLPKMRIS